MENTLYYGDNLDMPPIRQVDKTFKKAEWFNADRGKQLEIESK